MADPDFTISQGDSEPIFAQQITDSTNTPVNLTGATVALTLRDMTTSQPLTLTGTQTITEPTEGLVQWQPTTTDTAIPGSYMGKWRITYANGAIQSYPTTGYVWVEIDPDLLADHGQLLVSLPAVKDHININAKQRVSDAKLLGWIKALTVLIEHEIGPVIVREFDEWHDGGSTFIRLRRRPSTAIGTSPYINLMACSEYNGPIEWPLMIVPTPDLGQIYSCMLDTRTARVERRTAGGGVQPFPGMPNAVHVIYEAGQQTVPDNVQTAAMEAVRVWYETTMPVGSGRRTPTDELDMGPNLPLVLPPSVRRLLAPNKRHPAIA